MFVGVVRRAAVTTGHHRDTAVPVQGKSAVMAVAVAFSVAWREAWA
jgi:hypothetical protein